ncbi:alpha/beta fold hydrolase [Spirillospora albida]|uniref:alpha/beta fold hydrolase n=1 Tax=Spirillospora albida TaxID=58123 RepID=UPI0004C22DCA|nr:hypothetical protein [Spirillospora albida]
MNPSIPENATGVVLLANAEESVAAALNTAGLGTVLLDVPEEDMEPLTMTLLHAIDEVTEGLEAAPRTAGLPLGLYGAGTTAAGTLAAAAARPHTVAAVVSRSGSTDLALPCLPRVRAPVLLITGDDTHAANQRAADLLESAELHVIDGAADDLTEVTTQAADWFNRHLPRSALRH